MFILYYLPVRRNIFTEKGRGQGWFLIKTDDVTKRREVPEEKWGKKREE